MLSKRLAAHTLAVHASPVDFDARVERSRLVVLMFVVVSGRDARECICVHI